MKAMGNDNRLNLGILRIGDQSTNEQAALKMAVSKHTQKRDQANEIIR